MALIYCSACGRQVSDQAAHCPHCGHPVASQLARVSPPYVAPPPQTGGFGKFVKILGIVAIVVIALVVIAKLIKPAPSAHFSVTDSLADEACTQLGDYCIRSH